jgi:subtilisin family serine protease
MRKFSLGIAIGLVITLCAWGWSLVGYAQDSPLPNKSISPDEVNPKLETILQELSRTAQFRPGALSELAKDRGIPLQADMVTVIVEPASGRVSSIDKVAVAAIGGHVQATSNSLMRVRVPISQLEAMADQVNGIAFIRLPYRLRPLVTSEGVALTGADDFHAAGYYGQGTKVAIIDLGFIGLANAQAAGELDNVVYTHDYTGGGLETYTKHGTGVAEVVADMAPQASLYLLKIGDSVDLQNATQYCITNGIDIINHSVGWYNSNYYDGTGTVAGIANNARDNGILWVNAAGNEASDGHWQGAFVDSDGDKYLDFGSGTDYLDGDAIDEGNKIYLASGDTVNIYMTWDDWSASNQDYDLYLYDSFGTMVDSSTANQSGTQQPTEAISYTATSAGYYEIAIYDYSAPTHPQIEFFAFTDSSGASLNIEYNHPESSIIAPANSAKVLAAGAIRHTDWTSGPQEYFSSQGPSNASKYAASITKPDVCGPDGVSNYTYGNFYGTSAASPHVAGAAALLLSEDPTRTADQLQAKLEGDAIDMGASGKDNLYGSGRLSLLHLSGSFELETSTVSLNDEWQTVNLSKAFTNPVVVAKPLSYNGHDPAVVRIRNVTASSFEIRIQEWDYKDGWHTTEVVGYLVMERGHWTLPDGTEVEAGTTATDATDSLIDVAFTSGFSITPVVITAVTTFNGSDTVATRNRNITTSGFQTGMQEQEANAQSHVTETISYIAWEPGSGTADGKTYEVGRTGDTITDAFHTINFGFSRSVSIKVDEEASKDSETSHTTENVGYIAFDTSPLILIADMQTRDGGDTANLRYQESESSSVQSMAYWQGLPFVEQVLSMPNPVRKGETARFVVEGQGIESVQVKIYDLSGKRVFTSDWYPGDTVEWHIVNDQGRRLANGAYLYRVRAKGANGEEVVSKVGIIFVSY